MYETIILPLVLYGCVTWYLTLKEDYRVIVFEKSVRRRILEAEREEVPGG
jgi:hypothetical protein